MASSSALTSTSVETDDQNSVFNMLLEKLIELRARHRNAKENNILSKIESKY